jgi:hypothetical protein
MQRFTVELIKQGFGAKAARLPSDLTITPNNWSANDRGGCKQADLSASGSAESLAYLAGWVGDQVVIHNAQGDAVWWGVLWDLQLNLGDLIVNYSLDNVYNRVRVTYPAYLPNGSQESRTTDWAIDQTSIDRYGARELLYSKPAEFMNSAEQVRDQILNRLKALGPSISTQNSQEYGARMTAMGLWQKAASIYFTNPLGLLEFTDGGAVQNLGAYYTHNTISFAQTADKYDMNDSAGGLGPLVAGTTFTVSGDDEADNNDSFQVDSLTSSSQVIATGTFKGSSAGPTVTISWGDSVGAERIAQGFVSSSAWTVTRVSVRVKKIGTPTDDFQVSIWGDASGNPDETNIMGLTNLAGSSVFTEAAWTEIELATPVTLTAGTPYWFVLTRTGTANLSDGYETVVDEDLGYSGGVLKLRINGAWVTRDPDGDLPFRLIAEIDSSQQINTALALVDDFLYIVIDGTTGTIVRQFSDDQRSVQDEISELLDAGTSTGERLVLKVLPDASVVVAKPPISSVENLILDEGHLRYPNGEKSLYVPGMLVYGQYVDIDGVMLLDATGIRASRGPSTYVQESQYDAQADKLTIHSDDAFDPFTALTIRKG